MSTKIQNAPFVPCTDATLPPEIQEWKQIVTWLKTAKEREMAIRKKIAAAFFPKPTEGVNRAITEIDGLPFEIVLDYGIRRKLDEAVLDSVMLALPEDSPYRQPGVLIAYKPSLVLKNFRTLPDDQRRIFSAALTETPESPSVEINEVKQAVARQAQAEQALGEIATITEPQPTQDSPLAQGVEETPAPKKRGRPRKIVEDAK